MKKRMLALLLTLILLCFSGTPAVVSAAGFPARTDIDPARVAAAFRQDLAEEQAAGGKLATAMRSLMQHMAPYVQNVVLTANNEGQLRSLAESLMRKAMARLQGQNETEPTVPDASASQKKPVQMRLGELVDDMKRQLFLKVDDPGAAAQLIADDSGIDYDVVEGEGGTFYLHVDIEKNPQIFRYAVFRDLVDDLVAKQNAEMCKDPDGNYDYLMTYEHIAGELAFHILITAAVKGVMTVSGVSDGLLLKIYRSASVADLNITENRLPGEMFSIVGLILYHYFFFHTLRALGLIEA